MTTSRHLVLPVLVWLAVMQPASIAGAQQPGTVEVGGFLQLDRLDGALRTTRLGGGAGGRVGVFMSPRWELEGEFSYSQADPEPTRTTKAQVNYYVARVAYDAPWGRMPGSAVILDLGAGGARIDEHSAFVVSPGIGLRAQLASAVALRFDLLGMIAPNPQRQVFSDPAGGNTVTHFANYLARAGLSLMLGTEGSPGR